MAENAAPVTGEAVPGSRARGLMLALSVGIFALIAHILRFGYRYGTGDQDETLPLVLKRLDPALFSTDWFIVSQAGDVGVRWAFVAVLSGLGSLIPVWLAFLVLHAVSWLAVATAVFALSRLLSDSRAVAAAVVLAALVLTPQWTLGGNDLVHAILAPSTIAWGFALWGVVFHLRANSAIGALLLGLATLFQALVGLQIAVVVFSDLLVHTFEHRRGRAILRSGVAVFIYAVVVLPILLPLLGAQVAPAAAEAGFPPLFYIMAAFRNPHHYLPLSFPLSAYLKFSGLLVLGTIGYLLLLRGKKLRYGPFLYRSLNVLAAFFVLGYLFTEVVPTLWIAKLQLFKISVAAKPVLLTGLFAAALHYAPPLRRLDTWIDLYALRSAHLVMASGLLVLVLILVLGAGHTGVRDVTEADADLAVVEDWARDRTGTSALFVVPPSVTSFRGRARRSIVVNFKGFPFDPAGARTWFDRLLTVAPIELPQRASPQILSRLDEAYATQPAVRLLRLADAFEADYILLPQPIQAPDVLQEVFRSGMWRVYAPAPDRGPHLTMMNPMTR